MACHWPQIGFASYRLNYMNVAELSGQTGSAWTRKWNCWDYTDERAIIHMKVTSLGWLHPFKNYVPHLVARGFITP